MGKAHSTCTKTRLQRQALSAGTRGFKDATTRQKVLSRGEKISNEIKSWKLCLSLPCHTQATLPNWSELWDGQRQTHLRMPGSFVPMSCIADGADYTGDTTAMPFVKISLPCGASKRICLKSAFSWLQGFLLMSCQRAARGLEVLTKNKNPPASTKDKLCPPPKRRHHSLKAISSSCAGFPALLLRIFKHWHAKASQIVLRYIRIMFPRMLFLLKEPFFFSM